MKRLFITMLCLLTIGMAHAQQGDNYRSLLRNKQVKVEQTNLPLVFITVNNRTIQRNSYTLGQMKIIHNGDGNLNYGDTVAHPGQHVDYEGWIALKYRGNTSFSMSDKKPYAFRTLETNVLPANGGSKKKVKLLGMAKDNKWAFIAPWCDETMFRDVLTFELGRPWFDFVPSARMCEVFLDGTYYGVYVLCERVSKGKHRLNLHDPGEDGGDLTGDYHVSVDHGFSPYFTSKNHPWQSLDGSRVSNYTIKYEYGDPDNDEWASLPAGYAARTALINEVDKMEESFKQPGWQDPEAGYRQSIDVMSFIDYMLATELSMNIDGYRLSTHLYKYSNARVTNEGLDPRWKTTLWDYNIAWGNANYYDGDKTDSWQYMFNVNFSWDDGPIPFYWYKMLQDSAYVSALQQRWQQYRQTNHSNERLLAKVDSLASLVKSGGAAARNEEAWGIYNRGDIWPLPYYASGYDDAVGHMKTWIRQRLQFLDRQLLPPREIETEPVEVASGWNQDIVAETSAPATSTTMGVDGIDRTLYSIQVRSSGGLSVRRLIISANEKRRYRLAPFTELNALSLQGDGASGTLQFAQPVATTELFVLATSGNGASRLTVELHYADGTTADAGTYDVRDWSVRNENLLGTEAVTGLGNIRRGNGELSSDNHYCLFDFSVPVNGAQPLLAVTFTAHNGAIASVLACSRLKSDVELGVESLNGDADLSEPQPTGIYNLDGMRQTGSRRGLNIIRYADGTVRKVYNR